MPEVNFLYAERYGAGDGRAIDRHSVRVYEDEEGNRFDLSKDLSCCPPFYEIHGPYTENFYGFLPMVGTLNDMSWPKAKKTFLEIIRNM